MQELNRVLVEKLEEKMKGTSVEGTMEHLFRGKFTNYVSCINVDDRSLRDEEYYDLQMPVKGCKDLYASLDEYVREEVLDLKDVWYESETPIWRLLRAKTTGSRKMARNPASQVSHSQP